MRKTRFVQFLVIAAALAILSVASISSAFASTGSGTQNPDLTVVASLLSNGANPDVATNGNQITVNDSVKNNTAMQLHAHLSAKLMFPNGESIALGPQQITFAAGQKETLTFSFTVNRFIPRGNYTVSISASDSKGASSATASITIK